MGLVSVNGSMVSPSVSPLGVRGQFLRYVAFLDEFLHGVGWAFLSGAVVFDAYWVLLIQGLLPPGKHTHKQHHSLIHYLATINISQTSVLCITLCLLFPLPACVFGRWAWILYTQVDIDCKVCNNKYDYYLSSSFSLSSSCSMTALSSM